MIVLADEEKVVEPKNIKKVKQKKEKPKKEKSKRRKMDIFSFFKNINRKKPKDTDEPAETKEDGPENPILKNTSEIVNFSEAVHFMEESSKKDDFSSIEDSEDVGLSTVDDLLKDLSEFSEFKDITEEIKTSSLHEDEAVSELLTPISDDKSGEVTGAYSEYLEGAGHTEADGQETDENSSFDFYDFVKNISVYDGDKPGLTDLLKSEADKLNQTEKGAVQKVPLMTRIKALPPKYIIIGISVIAFILMIIIGSIVLSIYVGSLKNKYAEEYTSVIKQPEYTSNAANFIFVNQVQTLKNEELVLQKMLIDSVQTVFYLNKKIDVEYYDITLTDSKNNIYNMDLSFSQGESDATNTVLRFEPLKQNARSIKLTIFDPYTSERIEFPLTLMNNITLTPAKYLKKPIKAETGSPDVVFTLDNAVFSSAGSTLYYDLQWKGEGELVQHGAQTDKEFITITEGAKTVLPTRDYPTQYLIQNNTLSARMDFDPIRNLANPLGVTFKNIYLKVPVSQDIPVAGLFLNKESTQISFNHNNYKIVLERMGAGKNQMILVYHAEDSNILAVSDKSNTNNNRVEVKLAVELIAKGTNGAEVVLPGKCLSVRDGGDILFDTTSDRGSIKDVSLSNLTIRVKYIEFKLNDLNIPLNLKDVKDFSSNPNTDIVKANQSIKASFEKRLSLKSGDFSNSILTDSFSQEIINDKSLMGDYGETKSDTPPQYSAQVITSGYQNDDTVFAVVQEMWKGINGVKEIHFYRTHKVLAKKTGLDFIIYYDTIIK